MMASVRLMAAPVSDLARDEEVVVFAAAAHLDATTGDWVGKVQAWVYEPERKSLLRKAMLASLRKAIGVDDEVADDDAIFTARMAPFLVDNHRGTTLVLGANGQTWTLPKTGPNGHTEGEIRLQGDAPGIVTLSVMLPVGDDRQFGGTLFLIPKEGLSVVSDIDDTVKVSEVTDKRALIRHTFQEPFTAVPGMVERYQGWAKEGAAFHYVSASPWQLYEPLRAWLAEAGFPAGTLQLKEFRVKDSSFFALWESPEVVKRAAILPLLADFPQRQFVLVGDAGELDPEIYGRIAREHPGRIAHIWIRLLPGKTEPAERWAKAFAKLPRELWSLIGE